jgi:hypothetical protein
MAERARAPKNADQEEIAKLADAKGKAGKAAKAKPGHNQEPPAETIRNNAEHIEAALLAIEDAAKVMQSARGLLSAAKKVAKKDCGSKAWANAIEAAVKLKRAAAKGSTGEIITEHRQMGAVLRAIESPLAVKYNLFSVAGIDLPEDDGKDESKPNLDAELQGQHSFRNGEPASNNPFQQGTEDFVDWERGWTNAEQAFLHPAGDAAGAAAH